MAIGSWFKRAFGGSSKNDLVNEVFFLLSNRYGNMPRRGTMELLLAYSSSPWLQALVHRIASTLATVYQPTLYDAPLRDPDKEPVYAHPVLDLLDNPNTVLCRQVFWELISKHLDLAGETFLKIDYDRRRLPAQLTPISPYLVDETPSQGNNRYRVMTVSGDHVEYPAEDIIWLRDPDPYDPFARGVSMTRAMDELLGIFKASTANIQAWFVNGMVPDVIVSLQGMNEVELKRMKEQMRQELGGPRKAHSTHFTGKPLQVQRLDTSFRDQQLVELCRWDVELQTRCFGIPPEVMGILENSNRSTIEAAEYHYLKYVISPRLAKIRDELQRSLLPKFGGQKVWLSYENPTPEDKAFRLQCITAVPSAFDVGELRALAALPPGSRADEALVAAPRPAALESQPTGAGGYNPSDETDAVDAKDSEKEPVEDGQ